MALFVRLEGVRHDSEQVSATLALIGTIALVLAVCVIGGGLAALGARRPPVVSG